MKDLIDRKAGRMKLIDAPVGVFVFRDEFVLKTEYMTNVDGVYIPDCYILSTGEKFWGGMKSTEDFKTKYNNLDVEAIDIMPSAQPEIIRCTECKHYREYDSEYVANAVVVQCMADRYPISETIPDGWFCAGAERKDDE